MAKKKSKARQRALEARRRKNRREQNALHMECASAEPTPAQPEGAVALLVPNEAPVRETAPEAQKPGRTRRPARVYRPWRTHGWVWNLLFFLTPALLLFCAQAVTLQDGGAALDWIGSHPGAAALTYLLIFVIELLLLSLTGGLIWSASLTSLLVLGLSLASYFKQAINGVPLMPSDLAMAGKVGDIAAFLRPGMKLGQGTWLALGLTVGLLVLIALFAVKPRAKKARWYIRVIAALVAVVVLVGVDDVPPLRSFITDGPKDEVQAQRNDRLGLLAGLYGGFLDSTIQPPDAYNENNMNAILNRLKSRAKKTALPEEQPNVILLMSESFCDPTAILPDVKFYDDPIPNYHALAEEWPSGGFLSNTYAGGTGNVEMEVMTGIPNGFMGEGLDLTSLPAELYDKMPSIVKAFSWAGYDTEFIHSYTNRLYNRGENLPRIGFDTLRFKDDFPEDVQGEVPYISDMELTRELIRQFEAQDEDKPLFLFGLSMENHQPYFTDKFSTPSRLSYSAPNLNADDKGSLDALLHGLRDADAALGELLAYLETSSRPTIVVFWGDHLPSLYLSETSTLYSLLGYVDSSETQDWSADQMKQMHTTPFLVWNNYGADLSVPDALSCTGMGSRILDWAGVPKPLYFQWVDQAMQKMSLYRERLFVSADGKAYEKPPGEYTSTVENYRNIVYDILYGEGYISDSLTADPVK